MGAESRRQELRSALLDAAEKVVATRGLPGLKARDLAAAVGCAVGAIYTVVPDLDALVMEVNLRTLSLFEASIAAADAAPLEGAGGPSPADELARLGAAYLAFARSHPLRWRALFQHRLAGDRVPPADYVAEQARLFRWIEAPLAGLRPDLDEVARTVLARTLFSATHGVVSLGLDERLTALPPAVLDRQLDILIRAAASGLADAPASPGGR